MENPGKGGILRKGNNRKYDPNFMQGIKKE